MQWPGFFSFTFICVSLFYFPSFFFFLLYFTFYFHYHLCAPSLSLRGGGKMYAGAQVERGRNQ